MSCFVRLAKDILCCLELVKIQIEQMDTTQQIIGPYLYTDYINLSSNCGQTCN